MKSKAIILFVLFALVMIIVKPVYSASPIGNGNYSGLELYNNHSKFTTFTDIWGQVNTMTYATNTETGKFYLIIKKDNVIDSQFEITEQGMNTGYFYVLAVESTSVVVSYRYYSGVGGFGWQDGGRWSRMPKDVQVPIIFPSGTYNDPTTYMNGNLMITTPGYDGYKTTRDTLEIRYGYGIKPGIPKPGKPEISGVEVVPLSHTGTSTYYNSELDMQYSYFKATVKLTPGINNILVSIDYKGETYSDTRIVEYLVGFVDEDGDGYDDTTGESLNGDVSGLTPDGAPILPENATIFDYVKYAVDSIIYVFSQVGLAIKGMVSSVGDIGKILTSFFSFMPQPFTGIIVIGLLISIILRIFGR